MPPNFRFKRDVKPITSKTGFWNELTVTYSILPGLMLVDGHQIAEVQAAVHTLMHFERDLVTAGLLVDSANGPPKRRRRKKGDPPFDMC